MPKKTPYPRLRTHVRKGAAGQRWVSYWYDMRADGLPDVGLGTDYAEALKRWDELHNRKPRISGTLQEAFDGWRKDVLPNYTSEETRKGYALNLKTIEAWCGGMTWDAVTLKLLKEYLRKRTAKRQANKEMAVLSIVWNWARTEGMTTLPWPAHGMSRSRWKNKEQAREFEVTDAIFDAIYKHAEPHLRDALDLATATGLRVKDVVKMQITDVRGEVLAAKAGKTGKRGDFDLTMSAVLPALIERRKAHKALHFYMLTMPTGRQVSLRMLQSAFARARELAAKDLPEAGGAWLRDMRKRASLLTGDLEAASKLLQHSGTAVTAKHYPVGAKLKPAR